MVSLAAAGVWAFKRRSQQRTPQTGVTGKFNRCVEEEAIFVFHAPDSQQPSLVHKLTRRTALLFARPPRFLDDEAAAGNQNLPRFEPATFYEAAAVPGPSSYMPPTLPPGGQAVELTSSPAPKDGV